jgi:hypothetical protein
MNFGRVLISIMDEWEEYFSGLLFIKQSTEEQDLSNQFLVFEYML